MSINELNLSITDGTKPSLSLYVHIPFCNSKCGYCSFVSKVGTDEEKKRYFTALIAEIKLQAQKYAKHYTISSIYIGGGTPSCLDYYYIRDLLSSIYKNFAVKNSAEITIEINPNSVDRSKVREYVLSGVNRFSIGLQSISPKVLKAMGRTHTLSDYEQAIAMLREQGVRNISTDIIIGYPGQKLSDVKETINYLVRLQIPHISAYMLQVEDGTQLKKLVDGGMVNIANEDDTVDMYEAVYALLSKYGYNRYEVSNFALPYHESYHNKVYWNRGDYLGIGLAAHSYANGARFANTESFAKYYECIEKKQEAPIEVLKNLTKEEKQEEAVMLSLRTSEGLDLDAYKLEFGENFLAKHKDNVSILIKNGFLVLTADNKLKVTSKGFMVLNELIAQLV